MSKEKKLRKLKRKDLLEILLLQNKRISELEEELKTTKEILSSREIIISEAGSIAEASIKLNKIFEVAQKTADDYLKNIKEMDKSNSKKEKIEYNNKTVIQKEYINIKECENEKK